MFLKCPTIFCSRFLGILVLDVINKIILQRNRIPLDFLMVVLCCDICVMVLHYTLTAHDRLFPLWISLVQCVVYNILCLLCNKQYVPKCILKRNDALLAYLVVNNKPALLLCCSSSKELSVTQSSYLCFKRCFGCLFAFLF